MQVGIEEACERLVRGEIVAYPTETVYGLGCDVRSRRAVDALHALKGRPAERGISVLVADAAHLESWIGALPEAARRLAGRFWPGPLTLVLPMGRDTFPCVATELGVGFRCSSHPTAAALARGAPQVAIASTSCNRTEAPPARTRAEVEACFGEALPVACGPEPGAARPSTVVRVSCDGALELLREGAILFETVRDELRPRGDGARS